MNVKNNYNFTITACCAGYITQAITLNFAPLLFLTFRTNYGVSVSQIGALVAITFIIQIAVDFFASKYIDRIGYRISAIAAHVMAATGFILLGTLPEILPNPVVGIWIACFFYSFGSGLIEIIINPIVEGCPTKNKESVMGFLHSFYCWGTAAVILISTIFFGIFGIQNWRIMAILWAILPILNIFLFIKVPIAPIEESGGHNGILGLLRSNIIWVVALMMLASGAAELSIGQWASAFVESGLGVTKSIGDMAGPFMFAICMGFGRTVYSALVKRIPLIKYMAVCAAVCAGAYLVASLSTSAMFSLIGCALVGFAVGVFWPGTVSYAAQRYPKGGTAMFALLAFAGDMGCSIGPAMVGFVSEKAGNNLATGLLAATIFPLALAIIATLMIKKDKKG